MVWVSIVLMGMSISLRLKRRRDFLDETVLFLSSVALEIEFINLPVFDILEKISLSSNCKTLDFIPQCVSSFREGEDFSVAWSKAVAASCLPLKKDEREKLESLGQFIGTSDAQGQKSILSLYKDTFSVYGKKAAEAYDRYARMCVTVSCIIGMGIFILIV